MGGCWGQIIGYSYIVIGQRSRVDGGRAVTRAEIVEFDARLRCQLLSLPLFSRHRNIAHNFHSIISIASRGSTFSNGPVTIHPYTACLLTCVTNGASFLRYHRAHQYQHHHHQACDFTVAGWLAVRNGKFIVPIKEWLGRMVSAASRTGSNGRQILDTHVSVSCV